MKNHSMLSEIWRRFKKNKQALVGLIVLILFVLIAIFADQIAPYGYDDQDASRAMIAPCAEHIFGTDNLGRDQLSRLIYGSRYSLAIGFLAVGISVITGGILGVLAAYYPKLDNIIMRCMDLFMAIPQMLLAMCIVTALGSSLFNLMLAVGLSSTPKFARVVRAAVMSTREQEFVEAARAIGANNWRIIVHHILPNSISSLIVQATLVYGRHHFRFCSEFPGIWHSGSAAGVGRNAVHRPAVHPDRTLPHGHSRPCHHGGGLCTQRCRRWPAGLPGPQIEEVSGERSTVWLKIYWKCTTLKSVM